MAQDRDKINKLLNALAQSKKQKKVSSNTRNSVSNRRPKPVRRRGCGCGGKKLFP